MPFLDPQKCYAYQKRRLIIESPVNTLPDNWLTEFHELLAMQLQLDDKHAVFEDVNYTANEIIMLTTKAKFSKELARHAGASSAYTHKSELLESLAKLYVVFKHADTTNEQKNFISRSIAEDINQCTPGFHDRVNLSIILLNISQNLDELLAQVRFNLVDKIAHQLADKSAQGVHVHTRVNRIASVYGFGVWAINMKDSYEHVGSSDITDETIKQKIQEWFKNHFQYFAIINALCEQIKAYLAPIGYNGNRQSGAEYANGEDDNFFECINRFVPVDKGIVFARNNSGKVSDINWQYIKTAFLHKLSAEGYVTLSQEETAVLNGLLQNNTMANSVSNLIPNAYELAEFLQFVSHWSKEQKADFVVAYLQAKSPAEQKNILTILHNEAPQLTAELKTHTNLQGMYFAIAINECDIAAVRTYIDNGADLNKAILLLFSPEHKSESLFWLHDNPNLLHRLTVASLNSVIPQGKHQVKTIVETLVSTKKGRQLVFENPSLQNLFAQTSIASTMSMHLNQAQIERNTVSTQAGFFKRPNPIALQLVQAAAFGDMQKSAELLRAHPDLLPTLLTEKQTVTDYSRRKIKHKTAFQVALCAMDDELCSILARHMPQEELISQYQAIFPAGHKNFSATQTAFDFGSIIDVISHSSNADVEKALSLELPNTTALWCNLEQFRTNFTQHAKQETVFNPQHLLKAFEDYNGNYTAWNDNQRDLFWRQVVGYVQRFLPANIAMDFAQGLYERVDKNEAAARSFDFKQGGGSI